MGDLRFEPIDARRNLLGEGPFWDAEAARLYMVDIVGREVLCRTGLSCKVWRLLQPVSAAIPRARGGLIVTLPDGAYFFDPDNGRLSRFVQTEPDISGNRANEARTDVRGRLWIGTMQNNIAADGAPLPVERSSGTLSLVDGSGRCKRLLSGIGIANTLCWSPAGDRLYFADSLAGVIYSFACDLDSDVLSDRRIFSDVSGYGVPDGSAIDEAGYLWNARWGAACIIRFAPSGTIDRVFPVPVTQPTSCVFGGRELNWLYTTSAQHGLSPQQLRVNPLEGATLCAETDIRGERCHRFAG
jgi:sugar lactone lactonase YvrE